MLYECIVHKLYFSHSCIVNNKNTGKHVHTILYFIFRYGVKEVDKVHRLSGPGLETDKARGMLQGGGKWPSR